MHHGHTVGEVVCIGVHTSYASSGALVAGCGATSHVRRDTARTAALRPLTTPYGLPTHDSAGRRPRRAAPSTPPPPRPIQSDHSRSRGSPPSVGAQTRAAAAAARRWLRG